MALSAGRGRIWLWGWLSPWWAAAQLDQHAGLGADADDAGFHRGSRVAGGPLPRHLGQEEKSSSEKRWLNAGMVSVAEPGTPGVKELPCQEHAASGSPGHSSQVEGWEQRDCK